MAKEVSSLLGPDPRVPLEQWTAQAHIKDMNAMHILLSHTAHQEEQLKVYTGKYLDPNGISEDD